MEESMAYKRKIANLIVSYERSVFRRTRTHFTKEYALEWFYGVLFNQSVLWQGAWGNIKPLKKRLGTLNPFRISKMPLGKIRKAIKGDKRKINNEEEMSLHRYYPQMAEWLKHSCLLLCKKYKGDPRLIWNNQRDAKKIEGRLMEFHGMGQKKSSMTVNILATDHGIRKIDKSGIDISVDRHVRRVFIRTGLSTTRSSKEIIEVARQLFPKYPGILDWPAFCIGQRFCFPSSANCKDCPLG
ncbi:MAG TPA: hypothetical protein VJ044_08060, partial [Candidatus Hodarchaeales archaeon]|nr:hypothetical protein [Candidatus Hodarchaeales archaeon]